MSECIDLCNKDPICFWSTFSDDPRNTVCYKFTTCGNIQQSTCKKCQTYKKTCPKINDDDDTDDNDNNDDDNDEDDNDDDANDDDDDDQVI